jgi:hypothetical protein
MQTVNFDDLIHKEKIIELLNLLELSFFVKAELKDNPNCCLEITNKGADTFDFNELEEYLQKEGIETDWKHIASSLKEIKNANTSNFDVIEIGNIDGKTFVIAI